MLSAKRSLADGEGPREERLSLRVPPGLPIDSRQVVDESSSSWVLRAEALFADGEGAKQEWLRFAPARAGFIVQCDLARNRCSRLKADIEALGRFSGCKCVGQE